MISIEQQPPISLFSTPPKHEVVRQHEQLSVPPTPLPIVTTVLPIITTMTVTTTPTISIMSFNTNTTVTTPSVINTCPIANESPEVNEIIDITDTLPSMIKEKKRRMHIDDDDESPTFNPMSRGTRRGRGRGGRGSRGRGRSKAGQQQQQQRTPTNSNSMISSPDKSRDGGSSSCGIFTTPKLLFKENSSLQVFEEDTRMSANDTFTTPVRYVIAFLCLFKLFKLIHLFSLEIRSFYITKNHKVLY